MSPHVENIFRQLTQQAIALGERKPPWPEAYQVAYYTCAAMTGFGEALGAFSKLRELAQQAPTNGDQIKQLTDHLEQALKQ